MTLQDEVDGWFADAAPGPQVPVDLADRLLRDEHHLTSVEVDRLELYLFRDPSLLDAGPDGFALSHGGHGLSSWAWTLWDRRPGLRFLAQAAAGGTCSDADEVAEGLRALVALHDRALLLAHLVEGDLVVHWSPFRGVSAVEVVPEGAAPSLAPAEDEADALLSQLAETHGIDRGALVAPWCDLSRTTVHRVAEAVAERSVGVQQVTGERYVQWAAYSDRLQLEAVSDTYLDDERLGFVERRFLQAAGWSAPVPPDLPNHWIVLPAPVPVEHAADLLVAAARTLLDTAPVVSPGRSVLVVPLAPDLRAELRAVVSSLKVSAPAGAGGLFIALEPAGLEEDEDDPDGVLVVDDLPDLDPGGPGWFGVDGAEELRALDALGRRGLADTVVDATAEALDEDSSCVVVSPVLGDPLDTELFRRLGEVAWDVVLLVAPAEAELSDDQQRWITWLVDALLTEPPVLLSGAEEPDESWALAEAVGTIESDDGWVNAPARLVELAWGPQA